MKNVLAVLTLVVLTACTDATMSDSTGRWVLPHDMHGCRVVELTKEGITSTKMVIIRCPEGYLGTTHEYPTNGGKTRNVVQSVVVTD